jgi:hypothetical protein
MAREGGLWSDPASAGNKLGILGSGYSAHAADVCLTAYHAAIGTGLSRRKWLPFIPPLTMANSAMMPIRSKRASLDRRSEAA